MRCGTVVRHLLRHPLRHLVMPCVTLLAANLSFNSTVRASAHQAASQLPAGVGRDVTVSTCTKCHSLANVTGQHKDRDGWNTTITKMIAYGATGSDEDFAQILDYLTRNFGTQAPLPAAVGSPPAASTAEKPAQAQPEPNQAPANTVAGNGGESNQAAPGRLPFAATVRNVTAEDLLKPLQDDWLTYNGDYTSKRYSLLSEVNRKTVKNLSLAWSTKFQPGDVPTPLSGFTNLHAPLIVGGEGPGGSLQGSGSIKGTMIENDGVLYVTMVDNVWAVDARSG